MSQASQLEQAPEHIKLAVDLIYLLETNEVSPEVAIAALEIVKQDMHSKLESSS
ncbi:pleiotropic regulatory protein RsmS [Ferrimonas lipolytica]|uniref:Pleiotropic regulatory protein RsmS n=1 Tax=Ferrimonas lipolytica TaxID=2724191 RepID=A0A6H1UD12_9GAMM|nr:pleiotropic regulatory protein RsmS [Ferrimonas lipolytica]QIZ76961.1 pleiotropic regulatory protein RsmS [Ferrimonas lipolytica]